MPDLNGGTTDVPTAAEGIVEGEGNAGDNANMPAQGAVQAWLFQSGRPPTAAALDTMPALVTADEHFVWVDLASYGEVDLRAVADTLSLHRGAVRAALASWHRPRLSVYPSHFFVSATVAVLDPDRHRVEARELALFAGKNFLVTAHKRPLPFANHLSTRAHNSPELVAMDASFMLYLVLDETLVYYEELNRHLQAEVELLEERALRDPTEAFFEHLLRFKRYAYALAQLAEQHRDVFAAFLRPDFPWVAGTEAEEYFRDLESRLARVLDLMAAAREAVVGAFDIYVSHMAYRTNQVTRY